jgi:hypothetical protein
MRLHDDDVTEPDVFADETLSSVILACAAVCFISLFVILFWGGLLFVVLSGAVDYLRQHLVVLWR